MLRGANGDIALLIPGLKPRTTQERQGVVASRHVTVDCEPVAQSPEGSCC